MAALKKSGEEEWKKKIPRYNKTTIGEENKNVLNTIVTTLEENNKNNNSPTIVVNNNDGSNQSGINAVTYQYMSTESFYNFTINFKYTPLNYTSTNFRIFQHL